MRTTTAILVYVSDDPRTGNHYSRYVDRYIVDSVLEYSSEEAHGFATKVKNANPAWFEDGKNVIVIYHDTNDGEVVAVFNFTVRTSTEITL